MDMGGGPDASSAQAALARISLVACSEADVLRSVAALATRVVPGAVEASVVLQGRSPVFAGHVGPMVDERHAVMAVGIAPGPGLTGVLSVYVCSSTDLTDDARTALLQFSDAAAVVVANAVAHAAQVSLVEQLHQALESRSVIEQAKGMIMCARGCDAEEAFTILRKTSMDHNRKLHDLAVALVADRSGRSTCADVA